MANGITRPSRGAKTRHTAGAASASEEANRILCRTLSL
jgi:hypothetical protein